LGDVTFEFHFVPGVAALGSLVSGSIIFDSAFQAFVIEPDGTPEEKAPVKLTVISTTGSIVLIMQGPLLKDCR
jgi:hypothetical protein